MYHLWLFPWHNSRVEYLLQKYSQKSQSLKYLLSKPLQKKFADYCFRVYLFFHILKFNDVWKRPLFLEIQKQLGSFRNLSHLEMSRHLSCQVMSSLWSSFSVVCSWGQTKPFGRRLMIRVRSPEGKD